MRAFKSEIPRKLSLPEAQGKERIAAQEALDIMEETESLFTGCYATLIDLEELNPDAYAALKEGLEFLCTVLPEMVSFRSPKQVDYL